MLFIHERDLVTKIKGNIHRAQRRLAEIDHLMSEGHVAYGQRDQIACESRIGTLREVLFLITGSSEE